MKHGDIIRMRSFTHVEPHMSVTFGAPKGKVAVVMLLGEENKDGSEPLDLMQRMKELGWVPDRGIASASKVKRK
jgi:hypothetical protein